ncbi:elongator complex protein 6 [Marchantia polymorpha subsp. ruderalis]|uniref:Elongator complex protein 6 n=2 Tax=Marchantia polymorpha TaxID=3197 RepID=A0AAF6BYK6_MARPO|nr:hypothetical protein MARPO_0003s0199 [Marchantia polymorpha]BBN17090.1 hypothetical protein Mp_7g11880 [Marchantia polymorpha subsp. ruderalis]|eukprot:PTQ49325.1 hypothetical protein MARPO_0003s0199 [Marchantia polymorpha]
MVEELAHRVGTKGGSMVLIKDCVACRGGFLLHYLLKRLLTSTNARVVMLGLSEPFSHYSRIARKQGCNLQSMRDSGRFLFVDQPLLLSEQRTGSDAGASATPLSDNPLAAIYLKIKEAARGGQVSDPSGDGAGQTCIMIDDASILDVIAGGSHNFVLDFLHYCRALTVGKQRCSLIVLTHRDVYEEPPASFMSPQLEHAADTVITVEPLSTGLAVDVHGQVTVQHRTDQLEDVFSQVRTRVRLQKHQFRIMEGTVQFFLPGQA